MSEIIQKILEALGSFAGLIVGSEEFKQLKILISFISLLLSILFLGYFIYLEKKYKIGTSIWLTNIKNFLEGFVKPDDFKKEWLKIKEIFLIDHLLALKKTYKFLNEIMIFYDYEGNNLIDKYSQFPESVFKSKNDFLKALNILEIINQNPTQDISKKEALIIIKTIEKGLLDLLVIDSESQWASSLVLDKQ